MDKTNTLTISQLVQLVDPFTAKGTTRFAISPNNLQTSTTVVLREFFYAIPFPPMGMYYTIEYPQKFTEVE